MAQLLGRDDIITEGEQVAAAELAKLPDHWVVLCNKVLPSKYEDGFEIDFIVIADRHIFIIDEKPWNHVTGSTRMGHTWHIKDFPDQESPLNRMHRAAKTLEEYLQAHGFAKTHSSIVRYAVLLSAAQRPPRIDDGRAANWVILKQVVVPQLRHHDSSGGSEIVSQERDKLVEVLQQLAERPNAPLHIHNYQIEEVHEGLPGTRIFSARHNDGHARILVGYDLGNNPQETDGRRRFYEHEYSALKQLQNSGLVPKLLEPFEWHNWLIIPLEAPNGKALGSRPLPDTRDDLVQELLIAEASFQALDQLHQHKVLHRALTPVSIYVAGNQNLKITFSNFYAARIDEGTIAARLDHLNARNSYASPSLALSYSNASPESDRYSLALIVLERILGAPPNELRTTAGQIEVPNLQHRWRSLPNEIINDLTALFQSIFSTQEGQNSRSAKVIGNLFGGIARRLKEQSLAIEGRILDKRYHVIQLLGQGSVARTFLASDKQSPTGELVAIKQFFSPLEVLEQANNEYETLKRLRSRFLPKIYDITFDQSEAHIKMEYIAGQTLKSRESEFPWRLEYWWRFADQLLDLLCFLEDEQVLHRDIKPENIILRERDEQLVLIDFGIATTRGSQEAPAGSLPYLPPEARTAQEPPSDIDRYAAAVVLFRTLTGSWPFDNFNHSKLQLPPHIDATVERIALVLLSALDPNPANRPQTAELFQRRLRAAWQSIDLDRSEMSQLQQRENSWVTHINGLYRNSTIGNADNRGLDSEFVRATYVPTALDNLLLPELLDQRPAVVFLCGNPGDGKTAFLEKVRGELECLGANQLQLDLSGWEYELNGHIFRSCYDASESHDGKSADQQLALRLIDLQGAQEPEGSSTALIAINDGRLADFFERHKTEFAWLTPRVEKLLQRQQIDQRVWMIDLKKRAFVALDPQHESLFKQLSGKLVAPSQWQVCADCSARQICPISANAAALRNKQNLERLEELFLLNHLRRQHHMTVRDLRSTLAYIITGNLHCGDVHQAVQQENGGAELIHYAYWQTLFQTDQHYDELLADFQVLDPASRAQPQLDRYLHYHSSLEASDERQQLFIDGKDLPRQRFASEKAWLQAMKRRLYFEGDDTKLRDHRSNHKRLSPYQYANSFLNLLRGEGDLQSTLAKIGHGLLRSDGIFDPLPDGHISLKVAASQEQQLVILKQFPLDQFQLYVEQTNLNQKVETISEVLILEHHTGMPRLTITLDLFELLMRCADGLQPDAPELRPLLEDLAPFKSALLLRETRDLILIESQRAIHRVSQRNGKIVLEQSIGAI
jgi:serine/threonine protein kinase